MIRKDNGIYIQIDGIDGSGKSTLFQTAREWFDTRILSIFDAVEFSKREGRLPTIQEVGDADILFTAEPTHAWIGRAIRDEIIRNGTPYSAHLTAEAYALDRAVQIHRLVKPFLEARTNRWVVQDRGLVSTLAYQPLQSEMNGDTERITINWLLSLEGNQIALNFTPDHFILLDLDADIARSRLDARHEKLDDAKFEQLDFQRTLSTRFKLDDVVKPFQSLGTSVQIIDGWKSKEEVGKQMRAIMNKIEETS